MKIVLDNFNGGISPSDRQGPVGSYFYSISADPHSTLGYLQPGWNITTPTGGSALGAVIKRAIVNPVLAVIYGIESGTKLHKADSLTGALTTAGGVFPHTISAHGGHTTVLGEDVILYPIGTTHYLFFSWNDNTDGDVGRYDLSTTFDDDWLSTVPSGAVTLTKGIPHQMLEWQDDGYLYIIDGRRLVYLAGQTGANGTVATKTLLPVGWTMTTIFDAGEYIGIGAMYLPGTFASTGRRSRAAVFFWDGTSPTWNRKAMLPDTEINASYNLNGEFYVFTKDMRGKGLIRQWDGSRFVKVTEMRDGVGYAYPLGSYGQVDEYNNRLIFQSQGKILLYGSPEIGYPKALTQTNKNSATGQGGIVTAEGGYFASTFSGSTYYWEKFYGGADTGFLYKSLYYEFPQKIRINYVKAEFKTLATGSDDDLIIETDYGDTTTTLGNITFAGDGAVEYKRFDYPIICNNFRLIVDTDENNSTAGIVYSRFIIDFDYVQDI